MAADGLCAHWVSGANRARVGALSGRPRPRRCKRKTKVAFVFGGAGMPLGQLTGCTEPVIPTVTEQSRSGVIRCFEELMSCFVKGRGETAAHRGRPKPKKIARRTAIILPVCAHSFAATA